MGEQHDTIAADPIAGRPMRAFRVTCLWVTVFGQALLFSRVPPLVDQTQWLQAAINKLPPNGVLDCGNQTYAVVALQLKSNMTIQNCQLQTLPGSLDFASPITIDGRV